MAPSSVQNPSDRFTPSRPGTSEIVARAFGLDSLGNWISALPSRVRVTVPIPPACPESLISLDSGPNPFDEHGQPFSTVMLGGRLALRYYRLIDSAGNPVSRGGLKLQKREDCLAVSTSM